MMRAHAVARQHLNREAKRSKEVCATKALDLKYQVGDVVWCLLQTKKVGVAPKLQRVCDGPFLIVQERSAINFVIQLEKTGAQRLVHHDKLKSYRGVSTPKWIFRNRLTVTTKRDDSQTGSM